MFSRKKMLLQLMHNATTILLFLYSGMNYRLSGLEWLSSYRPRSPMSPLRPDKLNEVKYRGPKRTPASPPPNFLFTLGKKYALKKKDQLSSYYTQFFVHPRS